MDDLFIKLFAYRQRETKDPLEDWLTECLAATIRALPPHAKAQLLGEIEGQEIANPDAFFAEHSVEILTQYDAGPAGRPDMLIKLDSHPWILIENKVGHSVAEGVDADGQKVDQLLRYAKWLTASGVNCRRKLAVGFISHLTPPPPNFLNRTEPIYQDLNPYQTSWGKIGRRMIELTTELEEHHHARTLAGAFTKYLESKGMNNEFPDSIAFAAAEIYASRAAPLENLVGQMWQQMESVANFGSTGKSSPRPFTQHGTVAMQRFVQPGPLSKSTQSYLECGVWFPELGLWPNAKRSAPPDAKPELRGAHVYAGIFNKDPKYAFPSAGEEPDGFQNLNGDFIAIKPVREISADPQKRGEEIITWVAGQAAVLRLFLHKHGLAAPVG